MKRIVRPHLLIFALALGLLAFPMTAARAAGGSTSLSITGGTLTLTGAAPGNFTATLTGSDQQVYAALGSFTGADQTGSGNGWHITFQATRLACTSGTDAGCPTGGDTFPASSLLLAPPAVTCHTGTSCSGRASKPTISISANTALDGASAVTIASTAANSGMGTYDFTPGTIGTGNLQLTVPSYAYATTYHSTLTVSIVSGP